MCDHHWILNITNRVRLITKFNDLLKVQHHDKALF
jgi:ubiquitin-protein ligase E3 A